METHDPTALVYDDVAALYDAQSAGRSHAMARARRFADTRRCVGACPPPQQRTSLLEYNLLLGADINGSTPDGLTPLQTAIFSGVAERTLRYDCEHRIAGDLGVTQLLIEKGADVNASAGLKREPPVFLAVQRGSCVCARSFCYLSL
jgi:ankyrin repeat protein